MTVEEMHIAVNLGVQKIASFQADSLLPEEIDYELNTAMRRFVSQRYNKHGNKYQRGFEQSQKRLDDLRHLVEDYTTQRHSYMGIGYTSRTKGNIDIYRYKFPTDYMFLVNVLSEVTHNCKDEPLTEYIVQQFEYKDYLKISLTPPQPGYLIQSIAVSDPDTEVAADVIYGQEGLSYDYLIGPFYGGGVNPSLSNNDSFTDRYFDSVATDSPPADGNELYLEKIYTEPNGGFIPISGEAMAAQDPDIDPADYNGAYAVVTWVNPSTLETLEQVSNIAPTTTAIPIRKTRFRNPAPAEIRIYRTNCKFSQQDDIYALLDDPFNSTSETGILYTIQETFLDLYTTSTFIPNSVQLKYIRKPAQISRRFGVGCELPEHTHHEIVEMAVKSILEGFESPRYQTQSREVLESE